ncbi:Glycolipid transfer protein GLTP [Metschnikowia aff. pulcherrima]|uniref:Glycolipid transfer protein GLTP n=1 Tax=Metschnikowia aff. pulcherrima TaxID=2163413 RepID=A0A4P6XDE4_9ASCO|nr:Glycolipid transfer protein GLTP [Metschnikowia aff. pulcherrima]
MTTFFDGKKSFADVPVTDDKIDTQAFLEASEALVKLFDLLGSSAFSVVQKDMTGNIEKVRAKLLEDPAGLATLQGLILLEAGQKTKKATQGLLWLTRGLEFTAQAMRETVNNPSKELTVTFTDAYSKTLSKYHGMLVKPIFKLAMKACPYRKDFFEKLGSDQAKVDAELAKWLKALEDIVAIIVAFFTLGNYGKGL